MSALPLDYQEPAAVAAPPLSPPVLVALPSRERQDAAEEPVVQAERAVESSDYAGAIAALDGETPALAASPELALRALFAESWARMELGEVDAAAALLERARTLADRPQFGEVERAEVLFRLACCELKRSAVAAASSLLSVALAVCDAAPVPSDRLRSRILERRSRCSCRQRDFAAARADVELALELAERAGDERTVADVQFQASIVAEREGQWMLARFYAEEAKRLYERCGDREGVHRVLNNLAAIEFLLGNAEGAVSRLQESFGIALDLGNDVGAAYAMCSLAQIQVRTGEAAAAERHARRALELLYGRTDHLSEVGGAQLVLGRALLEQGRHDEAARLLAAADASFERLGSASHRAAVWTAEGDLASRRGDLAAAAERYRSAAEALQDFHF